MIAIKISISYCLIYWMFLDRGCLKLISFPFVQVLLEQYSKHIIIRAAKRQWVDIDPCAVFFLVGGGRQISWSSAGPVLLISTQTHICILMSKVLSRLASQWPKILNWQIYQQYGLYNTNIHLFTLKATPDFIFAFKLNFGKSFQTCFKKCYWKLNYGCPHSGSKTEF